MEQAQLSPSPSCSRAVLALTGRSALPHGGSSQEGAQARPPAEGSTARTTQPFQTRNFSSAIQAPAHEPQGSRSYRAPVITYVTFSFDARVRQTEKLKPIIITANEREGGSSAEQLRGPLGQKQRAHGTACDRCHHGQFTLNSVIPT